MDIKKVLLAKSLTELLTITAFLIQNEYKIIPHEVITYTQYSQDKIFFLRWKYFT